MIAKQIELIKARTMISACSEDEARTIFRHAVFLFRKYISPINTANTLENNVAKILHLCRLDGDNQALTEILAMRAIAQISPSIGEGEYSDLAKACGLDVINGSKVNIGKGQRVEIGENGPINDKTYRITFRGVNIDVHEGAMAGEMVTNDFREAASVIDKLNTRGHNGRRYIEIDYETAKAYEGEIFDAIHDPWRPTTIYSQALKPHPTAIIEPSTLAATPYPRPTYKPMLPAEAITRGFISDAQFETVTYALQAITEYLPGSPEGQYGPKMKGGFIIGDGTGVGKTNEFCAIIMDQWLRGKKRHIIVVERSKHVSHIMEAWSMIGGNPKNIMFQGERSNGDELPDRDGIMITTYALIRDDVRYKGIIDWATHHGPMEGVIVFDEAHNMRNAISDIYDEGSGKNNQSQQGMRGVEMQNELPKAGVIYASATMATDVYNLGYAIRLGLWGENAPFQTSGSFIGQMHTLDEAALEQICIDLKSAGRYCSRTLSFDGVEYEEIEHRLTPPQRKRFNAMVTRWQSFRKMQHATMEMCGIMTKDILAYNSKNILNIHRDTIEAMLTQFNCESMIEDIHKELAKGHAPIVQISMTGEARLKRMVGDRTELSVDEYIDDKLTDWVLQSFPTRLRRKDKTGYVDILDDSGNPIYVDEAIKIRDEALRMVKQTAIGMNAIDRLYLEFGEDVIAEMTGRSQRAIPERRAGKHTGWKIEDRSPNEAVSDVEAFQDGRKSILIFSLGAGGTGLSYHCAPDVANKKRRVHYILELGRRAESAVQGIGRSHRSGQIQPPIVKIVMSDIPAHVIYASKTLAKIAKMGALSRGHQHAASNAIFEQRIPLNSCYARQGWSSVVNALIAEQLPLDYKNVIEDLRIDKEKIKDFNTVLPRLAILTDSSQRILVDELMRRTEEAMNNAIRQGTYNQGLETIQAKSIEIINENEIENINGSKTRYYRLRKQDDIEQIPFRRAAMSMAGARGKGRRAVFMRHKVNGRIMMGTLREGISGIVDLISPSGSSIRTQNAIRNEPWKVISDIEEAERYWNIESENFDTRSESELHILSGSLLYNWDKLPKYGIGLNRCKTDDGKIIVGRLISNAELRKTLQSLGMKSAYNSTQVARMLKKVDMGNKILIDNGWSIEAPNNAGGNYRLMIPDEEQTGIMKHNLANMGIISYDTPLGFETEIPTVDAIRIIQELAVGSDMSVQGVTTGNASFTNQFSNTNSNIALAAMK